MTNLMSRPELRMALVVFVVIGRVYASTPNLVEVPDISLGTPLEPKSQYEPMHDERPVLHKVMQGEEVAGGAKYPEADELVIEPESESISIIAAPIVEVDPTTVRR
ncbi:hypothetical protein WDW37_07355 [Bdellovibrionota bacterium FG-1]